MSDEGKSEIPSSDGAVDAAVDAQVESLVELKLKHAKELAELKVKTGFHSITRQSGC